MEDVLLAWNAHAGRACYLHITSTCKRSLPDCNCSSQHQAARANDKVLLQIGTPLTHRHYLRRHQGI